MARKKKSAAMQAPQKLKLLITIVNREKADFYMDLIQSFDVNMQFRIAAKGTASSEILQLMGLSESEKAVIFSVIREDNVKPALEALEARFASIKKGKGVACTIPFSGMIGVSLYNFFCDNRRAVSGAKEGN